MTNTIFCRTATAAALAFAMACTLAAYVYAADPLPEPGFPQSCGVQLKSHNFTVENLDHARRLGFRIVRRGFYFDGIEKEKGVYDFSGYDTQMKRAKELGLTVVGVLFGNNELYEDDGRGGIQTAAGRQGFARFAAAVAEHYKDQPVIWEIWNEPNVRSFWRKDGTHNSDEFAAEYTALVSAVVPAMLAADPDCFVVAGSVSNYWEPSYEWTESCFNKGILRSGIRGWSVHPYGVKTPEEFAVGHGRMRELLKKYGAPEMPLLDTERGFAVKETSEGWSGGSKQRAREFQAWNLVRQFLIDQLYGVRLTIWYEWDGDEFGLSDQGGERPAYSACRAMFEQLDGYHVVDQLLSDSKLDYVLVCEDMAGSRKLVAWTAPSPGGPPDEAKPHDVAVHIVKSADGADLDGKPQKIDISTSAIQLTLSGAPQYVDVPSEVRLGRCTSASPTIIVQGKAPQAVELPVGAVDIEVFKPGNEWTFLKNTGDGSFTLGVDDAGEPIGTMHYDFTNSKSQSTPYVLTQTAVSIAEGAREVSLRARSPIAQNLTFRLVDSTDQTHQYKGRISGSGQWETIRIPLIRRLEHWGGAADGKIHFPIQQIVFSVPLPNEDAKTGQVEYSKVVVDRGS